MIYLVDGSGYIFRAYYAIRGLSTSKGFPTNAIYGFTQMLWKLIREKQPTHIAVIFDSKEPTFREEMYPAYKANRAEPPDDLVPQFPWFRKVVEAMRVPMFERPGFEADDIIGTFATRLARDGNEVVIVTGDKDFMQLVSDHIRLIDPMKEKDIGVEQVRERFGVDPSLVVDVLGLAGDSTDNVPGIPGVGEKTAIKLIAQFGSLDEVLAYPEKAGGKLADKIREHVADARLAKKLVTIHTEVPVPDSLAVLEFSGPDEHAMRELFKELEFTRLMQDLTPQATISRSDYRCILTEHELADLCAHIKSSGLCAFDTETTLLDPMRAELVGIAIAISAGSAAYIPLLHGYLGAPEQLPLATVQHLLGPVLADPQVRKYAQNAKFDMAILARNGLPVNGLVCDTMIASYVLNPAGSHGLDAMAQQFLDHTMISYTSVVGTGKTAKKNFGEVPVETAAEYSAEDADATFQLAEKFMPMLQQEPALHKLFTDIEMSLLPVLLDMEMTGVKVDTGLLRELQIEFGGRLKKLAANVYEAVGTEFNINSPRQLGEILFGKLQLPGGRRTKTGYSTDADVLDALVPRHPVARLVQEYRGLYKLQSTYIDSLLKLVHPVTGRIHTSFNQTVAETGRLSSSEPNLQNIPVRTEEGQWIREAFVADEDCVLVSADYSQIELRILAHMSGDQVLCEAFANDEDVHAQTAAALFGVNASRVTDKQRAVGKTVNFAVIYGQTPYGLSQMLGIDVDEAKRYIDNYFTRYEGVAAYQHAVLNMARERGYVETILGRRRYFPDINSKNGNVRTNAERMAFNTIFQGSAADIIKLAMIRIHGDLARCDMTEQKVRSKMLLQVHDELVFEVPKDGVKELSTLAVAGMEHAIELKVPLKVNIGSGPSWSACG